MGLVYDMLPKLLTKCMKLLYFNSDLPPPVRKLQGHQTPAWKFRVVQLLRNAGVKTTTSVSLGTTLQSTVDGQK